MAMEKLREHDITLKRGRIVLRPMTEEDWDLLLKWNSDADVLYWTEGDDVTSYALEDVQGIYRGVSQNAFCFIFEFEGSPIGECWLQRMNLERLVEQFPDKDCRRIDLVIGEKELWGRGIGTQVVRMLTEFGFEKENADAIFGLVSDYNVRSRRVFEKNGYVIYHEIPEPEGGKAKVSYDLMITKECFSNLRHGRDAQ